MSLGGGTFLTQNKVLPGAYINFISLARASSSLSDRGIVTMPLELDWGVENAVFTVSSEDVQTNSVKLFGYDYAHEKMKGIRDLFMNTRTLHAYRLNGGGVKASNTFAAAKYAGVRGNDLKVVIAANVDEPAKFDVSLLLGTEEIDKQVAVTSSASLVDNDFVVWVKNSTFAVTAGTALTSGTNATVTGTQHQAYLNAIEPYSYNAMGVITTDDEIKSLYAAFVQRMRDEVGAKFQVVLHSKAANYDGVINVKNSVSDAGVSIASLVYWVTGAEAGCAINKTLLNRKYDGEFTIVAEYTQTQLEAAINAGELTFHKVGAEIRVLEDINSLVTVTDTKGAIFKDNQTIRVIDQIANDIATLFNNKYLGVIPNDASGRISLWADIVKHHEQLQEINAIEDFKDTDVTVEQGDTKKTVVVTDLITVINAMAQLYMTVRVQ